MSLLLPILELIRLEETEEGTLGVLKINKRVRVFTLEPPDKENEVRISSIPCQQYLVERYHSPHHGHTFRVKNVPGRSGILFHTGNNLDDTEGCILLGLSQVSRPKRGIGNSRTAHEMFMEDLKEHNLAHLTIQEVF